MENKSIGFTIGKFAPLHKGHQLLIETAIKEKTNAKKIFMEAQKYAIGFYEKFGFKVVFDEFLEDGIPHVVMELEL